MDTFSSFREHALLHPNETAVKSKGRDISLYDLLILIQWIATELKSKNIKQGDRVSIHMGNSIELIAAYYACLKVGAIFVPLSLRLSPKEVKSLIQHSSSCAYIGDITRFNEAKQEIESCKSLEKKWIININEIKEMNEEKPIHAKGKMNHLSYEDSAENITTDALASIFYTSGTTGTPKGIVYSRKTLIEAIKLTEKTINPKPSKPGEAPPVILSLVDLISPWSILITLAALQKGYSVVLFSESEIKNIIEALKEAKPAWIAGTPSNFQSIINIVDKNNTSLDLSETVCVAGGDSCTTELIQKFFECFGCRLQSSYGQTELGGPMVYHHDLCAIDNPSIGWPLPDVEIKIDDTQSDNGELYIRSPAKTIGIWNGNGIDLFPNDRWLATGDIVRKSNDGSLLFLGREKDQIKIEGYPVYPIEIERTLIQYDDISDAVVFSIPDSFAGERIIALIQMKKDRSPDAEKITSFLYDHLSYYKHPSEYIFIEKTPTVTTGKISRRRLSSEYDSLKSQAKILFNVRAEQ